MAETNRSTMPAWMRTSLENLAEKLGHARTEVRWAAEECIRITLSSEEHLDCLTPEGRAALNVQPKEKPAKAPKAEKPAKAPKAEKPAKTEKAEKAAKPAKAAKAADAGEEVDLKGTSAVAMSISGDAATEVKKWRGALLTLVEHVISAGKEGEIPETWIKDKADRTVSPITGGRFFYTNLTAEQMLPRMKRLATILGEKVSVTYERDGSTAELALN